MSWGSTGADGTDALSELRTIQEQIRPKLAASGWTDDRIHAEWPITAGAREVAGGRPRQQRPLRADLALLHAASGHPIGVVEAKKSIRNAADGVQQAKEYGTLLQLPLVYATNGTRIVEIDLSGGTEHDVARFRTPEEIWANFRSVKALGDLGVRLFQVPYSRDVLVGTAVKELRYYQQVAVQRILQEIAAGRRRLLTVLATGTGKSFVAAQLVHSLWEAKWPRGQEFGNERPRVLYLADRDTLVGDPLVREFHPIFGTEDAVRVRGAGPQMQARINFASYQALDAGAVFAEYPPDWFDLVIVDECHRGSAAADGLWRGILDHFGAAVHLGLTATPRHDDEVATYDYFGEPVFQYSLRQGIADGFLAPFEVIRVLLSTDIDGVTITQGTRDDGGADIPARTYRPADLERRLILPERTEEAAAWLTRRLHGTDRMSKSIVFCVDQDHAARFVTAIGNQNTDLQATFDSEWAARITSDEGDRGKRLLGRFQDVDTTVPVVVASSDMLTTGVDAPTVRNVVFFRTVKSPSLFKQMLGRGTRVAPDHGKEHFTVIDFTGVTVLFADQDFDGPPIRSTEVEADAPVPTDDPAQENEESAAIDDVAIDDGLAEPDPEFGVESGGDLDGPGPIQDRSEAADRVRARSVKHVLSGTEVWVDSQFVYVVEPDQDFRLLPVRIESWTRAKVLELGYASADLRRQWASAVTRRQLTKALGPMLPFTLEGLAEQLGVPMADPLDLLLHIAFDEPLISRSERRHRFDRHQREFLGTFPPEARRLLDVVLDQYVAHGPEELDPHVLQVDPLAAEGSVTELVGRFGGATRFRAALDEVGRRLYDAS